MSTTSSTQAQPLTATKHHLIVAALTAAAAFVASLANAGVISIAIGGALGSLIAEGLTYEHSA